MLSWCCDCLCFCRIFNVFFLPFAYFNSSHRHLLFSSYCLSLSKGCIPEAATSDPHAFKPLPFISWQSVLSSTRGHAFGGDFICAISMFPSFPVYIKWCNVYWFSVVVWTLLDLYNLTGGFLFYLLVNLYAWTTGYPICSHHRPPWTLPSFLPSHTFFLPFICENIWIQMAVYHFQDTRTINLRIYFLLHSYFWA